MNLQENINRIKKLMEQDSWIQRAVTGDPEKCGLNKGNDGGSSSREDRQWDRQVKKDERQNNKELEKQNKEELNLLLNTKLDAWGSKVDKNAFNVSYQNFVKSNPDFMNQQSKYSPEQRYSLINKLTVKSKRPEFYLRKKVEKLMGIPVDGPISETNIMQFIEKLGGFENFIIEYQQGIPSVK